MSTDTPAITLSESKVHKTVQTVSQFIGLATCIREGDFLAASQRGELLLSVLLDRLGSSFPRTIADGWTTTQAATYVSTASALVSEYLAGKA